MSLYDFETIHQIYTCIFIIIKLINWLLIGFVNFLYLFLKSFFMNLFDPVNVTVIIRCLVFKLVQFLTCREVILKMKVDMF